EGRDPAAQTVSARVDRALQSRRTPSPKFVAAAAGRRGQVQTGNCCPGSSRANVALQSLCPVHVTILAREPSIPRGRRGDGFKNSERRASITTATLPIVGEARGQDQKSLSWPLPNSPPSRLSSVMQSIISIGGRRQ